MTAVTAGGTVHVAAGTYDESVTINKGLTLVGANTGVSGTATRGPESLVTRTSGQSGPDFNITTAARVTIDGFRAQFNGTDAVGGVLFSTTTANQLVFSHNVVDNSVYNNVLVYDTSATSSTIQDNLFTNIQQTGSGGTGVIGAWGVTSGALDALGISGNTFSHLTDSDGVPALNLNTVSGFVSSNTFDDIHQYGILLADKLGGLSIRSNVFNNIHNDTPGSSDSRGSGVRTFSVPNFVGLVSISHNTFSNSYHGVRVANDGSPADISSGYLRVKRNAMIGNSAAGISVASGTSGTLDGTCNWWGQASGPAAGQVAGSVTSSPFLTSSDLDGSCPGSPPPPPHATVPGPPGKVTSQPRNRGAMVHWSAPTDNGGSPINGYLVTPLINGVAQPVQTFDSTAKSELISGLKNGVAYKFRVAARNAVGVGAKTKTLSPITVGAPGAPGRPTVTHPAPGSLRLKFHAATGNGARVGSYRAQCVSGSGTAFKRGKTTTITVSGLTVGKKYVCGVRATNGRGTGPASLRSPKMTA